MVDRIEKIEKGIVTKTTVRNCRDGCVFEYFEPGETMNPRGFTTPDEVADFLLAVPNIRVRMEPGGAVTLRHIHNDGAKSKFSRSITNVSLIHAIFGDSIENFEI